MTPAGRLDADRPRRFYAAAGSAPREGGFVVTLDARVARTPAGAPLLLPTSALAEFLAAEWAAQGAEVDRAAMPASRLAATVIDRTLERGAALAAEVARYAGSDVLCQFAEAPAALVERQVQRWGAVLAWAERDLDVCLHRVSGVMPGRQPPQALQRVEALAAALPPFVLAGVVFAAGLYGSALLALAVQRGELTAEAAFDLSRLEEAFQVEQWGEDAEAAARTAALREEAVMVGRWFDALRP